MNRNGYLIVFCFLLIVCFASCAKKTVLKIDYRTSPVSTVLKGFQVGIDFQDQRSDKVILGENAKYELLDFTDQFSFSVSDETHTQLVGVFDLEALFLKTIGKRLQYMGAEVLPSPVQGNLVLKILLKDFKLTFEDRTWIMRIDYEAQLLKDDQIIAKKRISGKGERAKIIGTSEADRVVGDIHTDLINRLQIEEMFNSDKLRD